MSTHMSARCFAQVSCSSRLFMRPKVRNARAARRILEDAEPGPKDGCIVVKRAAIDPRRNVEGLHNFGIAPAPRECGLGNAFIDATHAHCEAGWSVKESTDAVFDMLLDAISDQRGQEALAQAEMSRRT